jgi:ribonuclease P protein component
MLSKKKRVTKELFQTVLKTGNTISGSFFIFRYLKQNQPQYAFVSSKKVAKRAFERNKLRRYGYNSIRSYNLKNYVGIFFYKKTPKNTELKEVKEDIYSILNKLR